MAFRSACALPQLLVRLLRLLRKGVVAQVDLNVQLLRLIGQLLEQLAIRKLRDVTRRFLGAPL
jgi:hypothetical protein